MTRVVEQLSSQGKLVEKVYGKQKVYVVNQVGKAALSTYLSSQMRDTHKCRVVFSNLSILCVSRALADQEAQVRSTEEHDHHMVMCIVNTKWLVIVFFS